MLWVLCGARKRTPVEMLRRFRGGEFRRRVRTRSLASIRRWGRLPAGAYLFVGLESWSDRDRSIAAHVAARLRAEGAPFWNDPAHALGRYELLRALFEEGTNSFDVYRDDEDRVPARWPVFLREERDHAGPRSELLHDPAALAAARARRPGSLIVEFVDTRDETGLYSKCGACRVGDELFARHRVFGRTWSVKVQDYPEPFCAARERAFLEEFPERSAVQAVFERARIDYGRIDFTPVARGIEVWEINTDPTIVNPKTIAMESRWALNEPIIRRHCDAMLKLADAGVDRRPLSLA